MTGVQTCALPICFPVTITRNAIVTDSGKITLSTIGRRENTGPNEVRFWYDSARWGNRTAISWEYQTPSAQVRGIR